MLNEQREKRQYPRVITGGMTKGRVTALYDTSLVDISLGGTLNEHAEAVRPATISSLGLEAQEKRVSLRSPMARSRVSRPEVQADRDRALIFHTGLDSLDPSDKTREAISDYIHTIATDCNGGCPKEEDLQEFLPKLEQVKQLLEEGSEKFNETSSLAK